MKVSPLFKMSSIPVWLEPLYMDFYPGAPLVLSFPGEPGVPVTKPNNYAALLQLAQQLFASRLNQYTDQETKLYSIWMGAELYVNRVTFISLGAQEHVYISTPGRPLSNNTGSTST